MNTVDTSAEFYRQALKVAMEPLRWPEINQRGIEVIVRRDDQFDDELSGNKFYKLFFNIQTAKAAGTHAIASFGGAYSNHLHALAAAGQRYGLTTIGIVRGERPAVLNPTLKDACARGMELIFVARTHYQQKQNESENSLLAAQLQQKFGNVFLIPEGGANHEGCRGAQVIGQAIEQQLQGAYDQVCVPCGTGTTLAGIAAGLPAEKIALGFSVLKGEGSLGGEIAAAYGALVAEHPTDRPDDPDNWRLISGYHCGGYARKLPDHLCHFWQTFEAETGLLLDPVYTLKMFWGIARLAQLDYWRRGTRLVVVHTGGLQGRRGFARQMSW